jgi:HSP20 family protein
MSLSRYHNRFNNSLLNFDMFERDFFRPLSLFSRNSLNSNLDMRLDIKENNHEYVVYVDIPGVNKSDIQISIQDNNLTISSERKSEKESDNEDHNYYFSERSYGKISRSINIPKNVMSENISAKYDNGVLKIVLPKSHETYSNTRYLNIE